MNNFINKWMEDLTGKLTAAFGPRLLFVGLQGSYRRGEETAASDIDAVVILDTLSTADLKEYKNITATMPKAELVCGFISGKAELLNWPKQEIFQFYNDTVTFYGNLDAVVPQIGRDDIVNAVKTGASGLYHAAAHTYLHGDIDGVLPALYKNTFFVLLPLQYLRDGKFHSSRKELLANLNGIDKEILEICMGKESPPQEKFEKLFNWCGALLRADL
ncbi:hypothetical protein AAIR98_000386 [Elusimicrobium simillimum]|uniref:nucleotidyltransferase domain-containing protein n=1 Tax=Elusimicrobium simillimum TaxID=3143438 RepID=UPI003C6F40A1